MNVNDLILQIRSRLSDELSKKWSENEMLDSINNAYIKLARELRIFLQEKTYKVSNENLIQPLPSNFLDIKSISKSKQNLNIVRAFNNLNNSNSVSIDSNNIRFNAAGEYKMIYYCYFIITDGLDEILLPLIANNAMIYYAIYMLLQKKPSQTSLQESAMYKNLFDEELKALQRDIFRTHETRFLTTSVVVV